MKFYMCFHTFRKSALAVQKVITKLSFLEDIEKHCLKNYQGQHAQPIFIIGAPRSGSTILYQLLMSYFKFAYLSNIASLFPPCPTFISEVSYKFLGEYKERDYQSQYGYIKGFMAPSEAGQLITRWFGEDLCKIDNQPSHIEFVNQSIAKLSSMMGGPCLFKNLKLSLKIQDIIAFYPKVIFLHIKRKPLYIAQSILLAKRKLYNDDRTWFSYSLPQKDELLKQEPLTQIVNQIKTIQDFIQSGKKYVPDLQFLEIQYEELCQNPDTIMKKIEQQLAQNGIILQSRNLPMVTIKKSERTVLREQEWKTLRTIVSQVF